jgi:hypothetical protein
LLIVILRTILPKEKRVSFIALVFAMSLVVMLLLKLFMRDDTWSVLDLLALCVSFCGVAAFIITSGPRGKNTGDGDRDVEAGRSQYPQANPTPNQSAPGQPPPSTSVHDEADGEEAKVGG